MLRRASNRCRTNVLWAFDATFPVRYISVPEMAVPPEDPVVDTTLDLSWDLIQLRGYVLISRYHGRFDSFVPPKCTLFVSSALW